MGYLWGCILGCVIFSIGFGLGCWWASRPDEECCQCSRSYLDEIADLKKRNKELEERLIGKNISNGKLGVQLYKQTMAR